jgi:hypothetical protein
MIQTCFTSPVEHRCPPLCTVILVVVPCLAVWLVMSWAVLSWLLP